MRCLLLAFVVALSGCEPPPPPPTGIPVPPDLRAELAIASLDDAVALADDLGAAGVLPVPPGRLSRSGLEAAGVSGPVVLGLRGAGGPVLAAALTDTARLQVVLGQVLPEMGLRRRRILGQVDAIVDAGDATRALIRAGQGALHVIVGPDDVLAEAAMLEAVASGGVEAPRRSPVGMGWRVGPPEGLADVVDGPIEGSLERRAQGLVAKAKVRVVDAPRGRALVGALASAPSPSSCAADDDALAVLHLPAVSGLAPVPDDALEDLPAGLDAFEGRLTVALVPPPAGTPARPDDLPTLAGLALIGTPRAASRATLMAQIEEGIASAPVERRQVGARVVRSVGSADAPWRRLDLVVDDEVFAVGLGAPVVVDRVAAGATCPTSARILTVKGPAVLDLLERAAPELRLVRRLAGWSGVEDPMAVLRGIERLTVDATGAGLAFDVEVGLTPARGTRRPGGR